MKSSLINVENLPISSNGYKFLKYITKGGFSDIFLVEHEKYKMEFVAKVMTIDVENVENKWKSFSAEISALSALNHPHVIRMYEHFRVGNQFILILEYCPGGNLQEEIEKFGKLSVERFKEVSFQILKALKHCHQNNFAHRDIKTTNILFDRYGRVKLADFGLSLKTQPKRLQKTFAGSLLFLPPEIIERKAHNPFLSDIWSLGVVFSFMAQGTSPWKIKPGIEIEKIIKLNNLLINSSINLEIKYLIEKSLILEPELRISLDQMISLSFYQLNKPK